MKTCSKCQANVADTGIVGFQGKEYCVSCAVGHLEAEAERIRRTDELNAELADLQANRQQHEQAISSLEHEVGTLKDNLLCLVNNIDKKTAELDALTKATT